MVVVPGHAPVTDCAVLESLGWSEDQVRLAQTHIISRAVYKDRMYSISKKLYAEKQALQQHLSIRTNEFGIQDKIKLYDLTNTYFEGRKQGSKLAKFGRSKEKRTDAKLVVLGLVINPEGFIKYSSILEGNKADSKTLEVMIGKLRIKTSFSARKALIVIDAGIATEENLKMILDNGYHYLCVSRSSLTQLAVNWF